MSALDEILTCDTRGKFCDICDLGDGITCNFGEENPCKLDIAAAELAALRARVEAAEAALAEARTTLETIANGDDNDDVDRAVTFLASHPEPK